MTIENRISNPMSEQNSPENEVVDVNELVAQRREKLNAMREKGQAFPNDFRRKHIYFKK